MNRWVLLLLSSEFQKCALCYRPACDAQRRHVFAPLCADLFSTAAMSQLSSPTTAAVASTAAGAAELCSEDLYMDVGPDWYLARGVERDITGLSFT